MKKNINKFIRNFSVTIGDKTYDDAGGKIGKIFGSTGETIGNTVDIFTKDIDVNIDKLKINKKEKIER